MFTVRNTMKLISCHHIKKRRRKGRTRWARQAATSWLAGARRRQDRNLLNSHRDHCARFPSADCRPAAHCARALAPAPRATTNSPERAPVGSDCARRLLANDHQATCSSIKSGTAQNSGQPLARGRAGGRPPDNWRASGKLLPLGLIWLMVAADILHLDHWRAPPDGPGWAASHRHPAGCEPAAGSGPDARPEPENTRMEPGGAGAWRPLINGQRRGSPGLFGVLLAAANSDANRLYEDLMMTYNRIVRPVQNNSDRVVVRLGLKLSQLMDVVSWPVCVAYCFGSVRDSGAQIRRKVAPDAG